MKGLLAFVACLAPVTNFKHEFLVELLLFADKIIHAAEGFVLGMETDNHSVNQKSFKTIYKRYMPKAIHSLEGPLASYHFPSFLT